MVEMLLVLLVMSMLSLLTLHYQTPSPNTLGLFEQQYLTQQIKALGTKQTTRLEPVDSNVSRLTFNAKGYVNQAQTLRFDQLLFVVQLGMGRYVIR